MDRIISAKLDCKASSVSCYLLIHSHVSRMMQIEYPKEVESKLKKCGQNHNYFCFCYPCRFPVKIRVSSLTYSISDQSITYAYLCIEFTLNVKNRPSTPQMSVGEESSLHIYEVNVKETNSFASQSLPTKITVRQNWMHIMSHLPY